ncbi:hypothetical protein [Terrisporobacter mayombei]|nr:hypothetical protein [Terrisporobacter mayombei]MCC3868908.1 hypothetical protein [Terrisporobacter mayombei]
MVVTNSATKLITWRKDKYELDEGSTASVVEQYRYVPIDDIGRRRCKYIH